MSEDIRDKMWYIMNEEKDETYDSTDFKNPESVSELIKKFRNKYDIDDDFDEYHRRMDDVLVYIIKANLPQFEELAEEYEDESFLFYYGN